tara:strand:- start:301 stop:498 length:198 start_codon:yes stop_codon:yes gene_type:complete
MQNLAILYGITTALIMGLLVMEKKSAYALGLAEGKLQKMEEFKDTFVPNPSNVFPDATLDTTGGF